MNTNGIGCGDPRCKVCSAGLKVVERNNQLRDAAPELLEALKGLVKLNEEWNEAVEGVIGRPPNWTDGYLDAARTAIAKAEGR